MTDFLAMTVREFAEQTAAKQPTPGGGAVAGLCGALAAALAMMAGEYTLGKKAYAAHQEEIQRGVAAFAAAKERLLELIGEDAAAYETLSGMLKLPEDLRIINPEFPGAVAAAIRVPQTAMGLAMHILELCDALLAKTNRFLISDLGIAAAYAHATVHASELNVLVNLPLMTDREKAAGYRQSAETLSQRANDLYGAFRDQLLRRLA